MGTGSKQSSRVKTSDTVFDIVEALHSMNGPSLVELDQKLDFAKSTLHNHLTTLEQKKYVIQKEGEYKLSLKFLEHGMLAKNDTDISNVGQPVIEELAEETGEVAWIIVEEHGEAVYLNKAMGEKAIQTHASVGGRAHLHHLATGKVILAYLPEERVSEIIDQHGLPELTPNTITDRETLFKELEQIREDGIAFNDKETLDGLRAIAAPVLREGEEIQGAVCISGPANRLTVDRCQEEIRPRLLEATNEIELKLQYPPNGTV